MARGGTREGKPGASYNNRTDLNVSPVRTPPVPTAPAASITESPGGGAPSVAPTSSPQPQFAPHPNPPGSSHWGGPSARPNEPITHGLPFGPGAGPEVLPPTQSAGIASTLAAIASQTQSPLLARLAQQAQSLGQ